MDECEQPGPAPDPRTAPSRRLLLVPVLPARAGSLALRTGRLASGERTGLAFTSESALLRVLGPDQPWVRLSEPALRALLAPLGVDRIRLDPQAARAPVGRSGRLVPVAQHVADGGRDAKPRVALVPVP
jgi:hypothetical protein